MRRSSTLLFALLAIPSVGDFVKYNVSNRWDKSQWIGSYELRITDFNSDKKEYLIVATETSSAGKTIVNQAWEKAERIPSGDLLTQTIANCEKNGGSLEQVSVARTKFNSCRMVKRENRGEVRTWQGVVPFGVLKFEMVADDNDEDFFRMETVEFGNRK